MNSTEEKRWLLFSVGITVVLGVAFAGTLLAQQHIAASSLLLHFPIVLLTLGLGWLELDLKQRQQEQDEFGQRKDTLFKESYEQVILKRQQALLRKVCRPLAIVLGQIGLILFILIQTWNPWQWPEVNSEYRLTATIFSLVIAGAFFVTGKTLWALSQERQRLALATPGGFFLYSSFSIACFAVQMATQDSSFSFLSPWFMVGSCCFAGWYLAEWPFLALMHQYGQGRGFKGLSCPGAASLSLKKIGVEIKQQAQNSAQYQFGYDLSSNLRHLLLRHGGPALLTFLLGLGLADAIVIVRQGQVALLQHWGVIQKETLKPGFHFKWPRPIQHVSLVPTTQLQLLTLGHGEEAMSHLWDSPEHEEDLKLLTRTPKEQQENFPVETLSFSASVLYEIEDPMQWKIGHQKPHETMKAITLSLITKMAMETERWSFFGEERAELEASIEAELQKECYSLGTGLKIHQFSLPQVHPPTSTVESFLETIKAKFEKEAMLSASLGQREQLATQQQFLRRQETAKAKALAQQTLSHAEAQSIRMALSAPIINIHPELYWQLSQLETLVEATEHLHKILLLQDANTTVQSLNLESNLEPELLDLNLETRLQ